MSMMTRDTSDASVTFSLAELARIEEERVRAEEINRAKMREKEAREQREAEARARSSEAARMAAEAEARARREREEAQEKARAEARERAAMEVARIEAEARARLEAANAERAHELAALRARAEGGSRRLQHVLAIALGLVLCGGAVGAVRVNQHVSSLELDAERLREGQAALARERDHAKSTELSALNKRYEALRARPLIRGAEEARATAEAARNAVDAKALDHNRMRAFSDALDVLQTRLEALERVSALDRRYDDLVTWSAERRRGEVTAAARSAAAKAKTAGIDDASLRAYEAALNQLRDSLVQPSGSAAGAPLPPGPTGRKCTDPNDPLCGLDGRSL
jgi:hypothetical protein